MSSVFCFLFWIWLSDFSFKFILKMSSLRNALPRRAHKERAQPWVFFLEWLSLFMIFVAFIFLFHSYYCIFHHSHSRQKFGLLEKHKDYVQRARAYHQKEQTIQVIHLSYCQFCFLAPGCNCEPIYLMFWILICVLQKLKELAANRNPDEFNFKMINTKTIDGVHRPG